MLSSNPQWVAVYTIAHAEKKVEANIASAGFESYLPLHRQMHKWSDRQKWVEVPLFSSYVFARITDKQVANLRKVDGVVYIVAFGNKIATIPDKEIDAIKQLMQSDTEIFVKNDQQLEKGARVRIRSGAFENMEGRLISNCTEGNFAVEILNLQMNVLTHIERDMLEFIDDPDKSMQKKSTLINRIK